MLITNTLVSCKKKCLKSIFFFFFIFFLQFFFLQANVCSLLNCYVYVLCIYIFQMLNIMILLYRFAIIFGLVKDNYYKM